VRLPELDDAFVTRFGFEKLDAFRTWMREQLETQSQSGQQQQMREQVYEYLLGQVKLDLPEGVLARMKERTLARRANDLMTRGVPKAEIEKHIDELAVRASEEAQRDLKTMFIMQRVAEQLKIEVNDQDVNALVAQMAAQYNRRPDGLRDELERRNAMGQLVQQIQETKAVDELLAKAKIEDAPAAPAATAGATPST
jgi:trigger factor